MNVIARLGFQLVFYDSVVYYTPKTPTYEQEKFRLIIEKSLQDEFFLFSYQNTSLLGMCLIFLILIFYGFITVILTCDAYLTDEARLYFFGGLLTDQVNGF